MEEYKFSWDQLGDVGEGRPNLGPTTPVTIYRLMQFTMRDVLEKEFGDPKTRDLFVKAGKIAGVGFCKRALDTKLPLNKFLAQLHRKMLDFSIGILRVEKSDELNLNFVITVSEDLDCSGLPINGYTVCDYDEGFFEGIFESYTSKPFIVKEIDCWSTGERTCRFTINVNDGV